jgi:hypothetical protein
MTIMDPDDRNIEVSLTYMLTEQKVYEALNYGKRDETFDLYRNVLITIDQHNEQTFQRIYDAFRDCVQRRTYYNYAGLESVKYFGVKLFSLSNIKRAYAVDDHNVMNKFMPKDQRHYPKYGPLLRKKSIHVQCKDGITFIHPYPKALYSRDAYKMVRSILKGKGGNGTYVCGDSC